MTILLRLTLLDGNRIKPGSNFNTADKHVAAPSRAEFWGTKYSVFDDSYKNVKIIQVLDFDNWHPLKPFILAIFKNHIFNFVRM